MCEFTDADEDRQAICLPQLLVHSAPGAGTRLACHDLRPASKMKITIISALIGLVLVAGSGSAQPPVAQNEQRLLALVQEVQGQQAQIAANQEKIESKLAEVSEAVRVARIYAGRGGK